MADTFIGIQIGAISFIDEGVEETLDILQEKAGINALMISALSWSRGNAGRALFGFPDHGVQEPDNLMGGAFYEPHPDYYAATFHKKFKAPDPLYDGFDTFADVIPAAKARGMKVYPYYCETSSSGIRSTWQPGFPHFLDRDHFGRMATRPSMMNPHYKTWWHSVIEDWFQNHDISGLLWGVERQSPLMDILRGDTSTGFDQYYVAEARARHIDVERAMKGYQNIDLLLQEYRKTKEVPDEGMFVMFLRQLLHYPEVLMWEKMWLDKHLEFYHEIAGLIRFFDPSNEVGYGVWQVINTYNPYLRAQYDMADFAQYADFLKPVLYHTPAGARFARFAESWNNGILADATPDGAFNALARILQLDHYTEPREDAPLAGFSPEYVKKWTRDLVDKTGAKVYSGIGVGVGDGGTSKPITPQEVREGTEAALDGGAAGILISRNYSEADLDGVAAVGDIMRERGLL
ncbi:MAG: hypothetical protein AAF653_11480 [Chloroflexota bacterium]